MQVFERLNMGSTQVAHFLSLLVFRSLLLINKDPDNVQGQYYLQTSSFPGTLFFSEMGRFFACLLSTALAQRARVAELCFSRQVSMGMYFWSNIISCLCRFFGRLIFLQVPAEFSFCRYNNLLEELVLHPAMLKAFRQETPHKRSQSLSPTLGKRFS